MQLTYNEIFSLLCKFKIFNNFYHLSLKGVTRYLYWR